MSRAVSRLEARLGSQLFHRTTRSLRLTEAGSVFYEAANRLISEREEAVSAMTAQGSPRGLLRITCSYTLGERFIGAVLREYAAQHSQLSISCDLDNAVIDLIRDGYDLAIRTGHLEDSRLVATRVASRAMVTVAAPAYLDRKGRPERVAHLKDHDCIVGSAALWHFQNGATFRPEGRWHCNSGTMVMDAALAEMGICQLPAFYASAAMAKGQLEEVLAAECPDDEPIWAIYPQLKHLSPKVSMLVALLRQRLPGLLAGQLPT